MQTFYRRLLVFLYGPRRCLALSLLISGSVQCSRPAAQVEEIWVPPFYTEQSPHAIDAAKTVFLPLIAQTIMNFYV